MKTTKELESERQKKRRAVIAGLKKGGLTREEYTLTSNIHNRKIFRFKIRLNEGVVTPKDISETLSNLTWTTGANLAFN